MWVYRLILAALVILTAEAILTIKFGLFKVKLKRSFDTSHAVIGQQIHLIEEISNNKILPVPCLKVESRIDSSLHFGVLEDLNILQNMFHISLFSLLPYTRIKRTHKVKCNQRGYFCLKTAALTARSITGSVSSEAEVETHAELYVFPRALSLYEMKLPSHNWQGDMVVRRWIIFDPFVNAGVREYTSSDPLKNINWKASARTNNLQVNMYEPTTSHKLMIMLNVDTSLEQWSATLEPKRVEYGISVVATILEYAYKNSIEVGFASNGYLKEKSKQHIYVEPALSKNNKIKILKKLARLEIDRGIPFNSLMAGEIEKKSNSIDYLLLTAVINDDTQNKTQQLRKMGNAVEILKI